MTQYCHTCGGELAAGSGESPFCPHCGSPQLTLSLDYQSPETGGEPVPGTASTGTRPPPRPQQVDWQMAIRCAAAVAVVAGLLSVAAARFDAVSPLSSLWVLSGSLIALGFYQRRRPAAWMDVGVGARIGVVVGICMAFGLAVPMAATGLVARYGLHRMGSFDGQMNVQVQTVLKAMQQQTGGAQVPPELVRLVNSPEFRGGMTIAGFALLAMFLLVLSTVSGAFVGLLRMRRKSPAV